MEFLAARVGQGLRRKCPTLQRHNNKNSKYIFPEKDLRDLSPDFHIDVSRSDLHISTTGLPILLQENMVTYTCTAHIHITMENGTEAAQFLFWKHINGIFIAV
jgi:hypothetical protein